MLQQNTQVQNVQKPQQHTTTREMMRYGKKGMHRKNVLFTFQYPNSNMIYFGVSRCNKLDKFDKQVGLSIAQGRAHKFAQMFTNTMEDNGFNFLGQNPEKKQSIETELNRETIAGTIPSQDIKHLLRWFKKLK